MTPAQVLANIRETNLTYMDLARKLIASDRAKALVQLGISDAAADMLATLSPLQMERVSSGNTLLCSARITDDLVWGLLTSHRRPHARNDATGCAAGPAHDDADKARADELLGQALLAA
jgi:flagellar transcriptional activator FlhD